MENVKQIVIVGPTASGKTGLSIEIAKKFNGQIISADSRAIYKELVIGTAKPSAEERQGIVHYGFDLVFPNQKFSSIKFQKYASEMVTLIHKSSKLPIMVGGSGLYIDSYLFDFKPPKVNSEEAATYESMSVHELQKIIINHKYIMPKNNQNRLHLINTILRRGVLPTKNQRPKEGTLIIGLNPGKQVLQKNIKQRADYMLNNGVLEEAISAFEKYGYYAPGLRGGIYSELVKYHKDGMELETVKENFVKSDIHLAKRQMTWFKRNSYIKWFNSAVEAKKYLGLLN
jgi:tRNA dimethylallyltransferase